LAYVRYLEGKEEPVLVLLNFSAEQATVQVTLQEEFAALTGRLSDLLNDEDVLFHSTSTIQMNPMSARILTVREE
ncbi:MAG TPA: hypothetical protein VIR02_18550, partial [Anaerolineales bacterium]